jgi:hypothetical protein
VYRLSSCLLAFGIGLALGVPAHAVTISVSKTNPNYGITPTAPVFENFSTIGKGYATVVGQATGPVLVNPSSGPANVNARVYNTATVINGVARRPGVTGGSGGNDFAGLSEGNFAAVGANGRYTVIFADYANLGPVLRSFSVALGSLSAGNKITLISQTGIAANNTVLTGFGIVNNDTNVAGSNYRVRFDAGSAPTAGWTGAIFESTTNSFEFDTLAGAAPEPGTWAMLTLGFGLAGFALRRPRRTALA